ncbi:transcriptional regulator [Paenibacillus selenitireducens]|uniref:Transcriptional regulator n=1 Tax=Paenibacillus selenitireducens TaxID=1324314 RepID=A0A1T2X447_9BACL|nr:PLD nuclease N-terminal domain-containing protein [Paenibacillus selenitireducens]OPA74333.1 transcriptional regulator [Paenibacillus selenitireducens]
MNLTVNWNIIAPILVIQLILLITALVSLYKTSATRGPKWMWIPIIIFVSIFGPVLYFVIGRKDA